MSYHTKELRGDLSHGLCALCVNPSLAISVKVYIQQHKAHVTFSLQCCYQGSGRQTLYLSVPLGLCHGLGCTVRIY